MWVRERKYVETFETRIYRRMRNIRWADIVRNETDVVIKKAEKENY